MKDMPSMMAHAIRILTMDAVEQAGSGHPGMPMGMADVATVLFSHFFKHFPPDPSWPDRDRFVLSAGHGSLLLYSLLYLTGYEHMPLEEIKRFRQWGSATPGHPEHSLGIETTTGPLAQGFANAVGMALAERILSQEFDCIDHYTYAIVSDGCLMEGLSQEALSLAGHWKLNKLIVFFDDNQVTIEGSTDLSSSDQVLARFQSSGWATCQIDGHNHKEIFQAIQNAHQSSTPTLIACRTQIGYGAPSKANTAAAHGAPLGAEEVKATRQALGWPELSPFVIPEDILIAWRAIGCRHHKAYHQWHQQMRAYPRAHEFWKRQTMDINPHVFHALHELKQYFHHEAPTQATRKTSGQVLKKISSLVPLLAGAADLGESTQIIPQGPVFSSSRPQGHYIHYGVREHAMAAIMNGIALHKGFVPCGGTFLVFSDYCRPAIRLSALMRLRVIYIMTHDSIGLGEDGPTHQPIEHLASFRAMPNIHLFRPADAVEVVECWELALRNEEGPSMLCLTRQNVPTLRSAPSVENLSARGAYILHEVGLNAYGQPLEHHVDLWATGSEVSLACDIRQVLQDKGWGVRVISFPCWNLFQQQPHSYQSHLLCSSALKVSIEAASPLGWERYVGPNGLIFGLDHFGSSAPYRDLYHHFGLTAESISEAILRQLRA